MSTGLECEFFEPKQGQWFYALQDYSCPVGAWDWREHAQAYGPFDSEEKAQKHLRDNHANPGGHILSDHASFTMGDSYKRLIRDAHKPNDPRRFR